MCCRLKLESRPHSRKSARVWLGAAAAAASAFLRRAVAHDLFWALSRAAGRPPARRRVCSTARLLSKPKRERANKATSLICSPHLPHVRRNKRSSGGNGGGGGGTRPFADGALINYNKRARPAGSSRGGEGQISRKPNGLSRLLARWLVSPRMRRRKFCKRKLKPSQAQLGRAPRLRLRKPKRQSRATNHDQRAHSRASNSSS